MNVVISSILRHARAALLVCVASSAACAPLDGTGQAVARLDFPDASRDTPAPTVDAATADGEIPACGTQNNHPGRDVVLCECKGGCLLALPLADSTMVPTVAERTVLCGFACSFLGGHVGDAIERDYTGPPLCCAARQR